MKGGTILIPLRSMFEQMGATVRTMPAARRRRLRKPGAEVKVTVGKPEVLINGESRPLDVPPIIYQGIVLVPVRVISEGMGAYVLWVADKRLVVVRYLPATPPPPPPPTEAPRPPPPHAGADAQAARIRTSSWPATTSSRRKSTTSLPTEPKATARGRSRGGMEFDVFEPSVDDRRRLQELAVPA